MILVSTICVFILVTTALIWPLRGKLLFLDSISQNEVPLRILVVKSWIQSRVGLLNHSLLAPSEALAFRVGRAVTTSGMHFSIDIVFLDKKNCVLRIETNVKPAQRVKSPSATLVVETAAGCAQRYFEEGRVVDFKRQSEY